MRTRKVRGSIKPLLGLVAALSLAATGCSATNATSGTESEIVKLGAILPITGPVSEWGDSNGAILRMLQAEVNADGGINGKQLEIVIYDSGAKGVEAANLVRKLASEDNVLAIMGPFTSSEAEVAFPVANELEIPITSQASSKPGVAEANRPWAFRNTVDESIYLKSVVPVMVEVTGAKNVVIAYDSADAVGSAIGTKILPAIMEGAGMPVVDADNPITFGTTDIDLKAQAGTISSGGAHAVGVGAFYNGAAKLLREMDQQGLKTPIFGGSTLVSANILEAAPGIAIFSAGTYYPGAEMASDWTKRAVKAFAAEKVPGAPTMFDSQLYEIGLMYVEAIRTGKLDEEELAAAREGIRDFMENVEGFEGLTGKISMNESGDARRDFFVIRGEGGAWSKLKTVSP
jgi:branched-chain amino acid transport system substrate-binding protein